MSTRPKDAARGAEEPSRSDPYVNWWELAEGARMTHARRIHYQSLDAPVFGLGAKSVPGDLPVSVPLPAGAANPAFDPEAWDSWSADPDDYPHIRANDVICGIIDTSFALGHRRLRFENGESRFLAAWLQGADISDLSDAELAAMAHLPFGRELSTRDIEANLKRHSGLPNTHTFDGTGVLDEDGFNRAIGAVDAERTSWEGAKELQSPISHGTHVLDVAAGITPGRAGADLTGAAPRCHLIAISLPPLFFHGHSGNFLQYHAVLGLRRIIKLADAISAAKGFGPDHQFPVVVNFSFGFEAGPKDGSLPMEQAIRSVIRDRALAGGKRRPVRTFVNMPAGNSNLERIALEEAVTPQGHTPFELNVQPADHSSTYVELWSEPFNRSSNPLADLALELTPPVGAPVTLDLPAALRRARTPVNVILETGDFVGRVYASQVVAGLRESDQVRLRIVLALAPTLLFHDMGRIEKDGTRLPVSLAPAGRWRMQIRGLSSPLHVRGYVQADLFGGPLSQNARRAYFDHPDYRRYRESGQVRDSYTSAPPHESLDSGPVRRTGTHNALATTTYSAMIGGFQASSGGPVSYSATGYTGPPDTYSGADVDVMFPCEEGAAHSGILGAGSRDGTIVAMNGTSVASALASRMMIDALLRDPTEVLGQPWLQAQALAYARPAHYVDPPPKKAGAGHLPYPDGYAADWSSAPKTVRRRGQA